MKANQKGFTLAESLIVLSIFVVLASVTIFSLKPENNLLEDEAFLTQLQADLFYAQNYALSHQHEVLVVFSPSQYKYNFSERTAIQPFFERKYSKKYYITEGSLLLTIKFMPNGNLNGFGTIFIRTKTKTYRLTFLIGRGRFYVTEQ
ncbi:competence type IV pilus minor pilin ComGD [Neobacillus mesonae]|uniref:competence type IV pilus minor pilin ComGD n=1 Tax=Neobacillus mesonae TaxID=1193713 RepID=UPI00203BBC25|nr:competence type IV pilus minor pilin ComGD [Neobacillus mesonae]MCM3566624.1 type II secretion system GspH family protein [Neobacillus mesonae]